QAPRARIAPEALPLAENQELREAHLINERAQLRGGGAECVRLAPDQLGGPREIVRAAVPDLQRAEERVSLQPVRLLGAELFVRGLLLAEVAGLEGAPRDLEQAMLEAGGARVIHARRALHARPAIPLAQQALLHKEFGADQEGVAGE